jgi:hypothetical protein
MLHSHDGRARPWRVAAWAAAWLSAQDALSRGIELIGGRSIPCKSECLFQLRALCAIARRYVANMYGSLTRLFRPAPSDSSPVASDSPRVRRDCQASAQACQSQSEARVNRANACRGIGFAAKRGPDERCAY